MEYYKMNTPKLSLSKGVGLIEVLVTIVITSIGLMGLVSLQMQSVRATSDSGNRSQAIWIWNDMAARIRANKNASASYIDSSPISCEAQTPICSSYHNGTDWKTPPKSCTGQQLANWDRYEVACPLRPTPFIGDANKYLPDMQITITCVNAPCVDGDPLNIDLQWRARTDDEVVTGAARTADSGLLKISYEMNP